MNIPHVEYTAQFSVGSLLNRAKRTLFTQPFMFMSLALIVVFPTFIGFFSVILPRLLGDGEAAGSSILCRWLGDRCVIDLLSDMLDGIFAMLLQGAFTFAVFQICVGRSALLGTSLSRGMRRFFPIVSVAFLTVFGITVAFFLPLLLPILFGSWFFLFIAGLLSLLFLCWILCAWTVAIPVCVVECLGPIESICRSAELTKGYRLKILALLMPMYILFLIPSIAGTLIFESFLISTGPFLAKISFLIGFVLLSPLPAAFLNVINPIIYCDLRWIKEGVTVDSLAAVFD